MSWCKPSSGLWQRGARAAWPAGLALAALLHGNISQALHANALTTLMLPFAGVYAATCYWRYLRHQPLRLPQLPAKTTYAGIAIALGFTILRNL